MSQRDGRWAVMRSLSRLECIGETIRQALNVLATVVPDWLSEWVPADWYDRYNRRFEDYRLPNVSFVQSEPKWLKNGKNKSSSVAAAMAVEPARCQNAGYARHTHSAP